MVVTKKAGAGGGGAKGARAGGGGAGGSGAPLPRIVIKVDLTKVGNDKKPQQQPKKKQGEAKRKPQSKVVLH